MMNFNRPTTPAIHEAAIRIARKCRHIVQAVLREEEWAECDREFYLVAREELEVFGPRSGSDREPSEGPVAGQERSR